MGWLLMSSLSIRDNRGRPPLPSSNQKSATTTTVKMSTITAHITSGFPPKPPFIKHKYSIIIIPILTAIIIRVMFQFRDVVQETPEQSTILGTCPREMQFQSYPIVKPEKEPVLIPTHPLLKYPIFQYPLLQYLHQIHIKLPKRNKELIHVPDKKYRILKLLKKICSKLYKSLRLNLGEDANVIFL